MDSNIVTGLAYILIGGVFSGVFAIPFKKNVTWKWENNWFVWSFVALLLAPWLVGIITVPHLFSAITADTSCLWLVFAFGLVWGYGAILFGKGIDTLGVSLGQPIMLGLINSIGTLMPLVTTDATALLTPSGLKIVGGVLVILLGIVFYSIAGSMRVATDQRGENGKVIPKSTFKKGLIICILAGVFGPMINFAFVYGEPMRQAAIVDGTSLANAANPIWCVALSAGFVINIIACVRSFRRNRSFGIYGKNVLGVAFAAFGGLLWYMSIMFYGMGGNIIGEQGASIGWATMQSSAIIAGCVAGCIAGEWKNSSRKSMLFMFAGLFLLVAGVIIIAF